MKQSKSHFLAIMALTILITGAAAPGLAFATEDDAADDSSLDETSVEAISAAVASITLYNRIGNSATFANFRKNRNLLVILPLYEILTTKIKDREDAEEFLASIDEEHREAVAEMTPIELINTAKDSPEYAESEFIQEIVDTLSELASLVTNQWSSEYGKVFPTGDSSESSTPAEMIAQVKALPDYVKESALANSMAFLLEAGGTDENPRVSFDGLAITPERLNDKYSDQQLYDYYTKMAEAAAAIDPEITNGLVVNEPTEGPTSDPDTDQDAKDPAVPSELPQASAPDTGIADLLETSALDTAQLTILVAASLAALAGAGLIAKLYLKRKF